MRKEGKIMVSVQSNQNVGEITVSTQAKQIGEIQVVEPSQKGEITVVTQENNSENVLIINYREVYKRELSVAEKEAVRHGRGFVNENAGFIILPYKTALSMSQKQASAAEITNIIQKAAFTPGGAIATIHY